MRLKTAKLSWFHLDMDPGGQQRAAIEDADVIEAKKAALEYVVAFRVLAIDHHVKTLR